MKPAPFTYHDPTTADEAVALLATHEDAKILAGGQSLMPMLNMRFVVPDDVIDLNRIDGIAGIRDAGESIEIGAMTRQRDLMRDDVIATKAPIIPAALHWVGHFQTRNRGTIGGSLCHLDPAAELPCLMALYDAELTVQGPDGARKIPFAEGLNNLTIDGSGDAVTAPNGPATANLKSLKKFFVRPEKKVEGTIFHLHAFLQQFLIRVGELDPYERWEAFATSSKEVRRIKTYSGHARDVVEIER